MVRSDLLIARSSDMVPDILGTGSNHFGPEQSHLGCKAWTPLSISKVTASNQQLEFDSCFLKGALICPTKNVGVILVFPEDLGGLLIQDRPQSGHYKNSNHSKAYKVVSVAQSTSARLEILTT